MRGSYYYCMGIVRTADSFLFHCHRDHRNNNFQFHSSCSDTTLRSKNRPDYDCSIRNNCSNRDNCSSRNSSIVDAVCVVRVHRPLIKVERKRSSIVENVRSEDLRAEEIKRKTTRNLIVAIRSDTLSSKCRCDLRVSVGVEKCLQDVLSYVIVYINISHDWTENFSCLFSLPAR